MRFSTGHRHGACGERSCRLGSGAERDHIVAGAAVDEPVEPVQRDVETVVTEFAEQADWRRAGPKNIGDVGSDHIIAGTGQYVEGIQNCIRGRYSEIEVVGTVPKLQIVEQPDR